VLKESYDNVTIFNGSAVADQLRECADCIDDYVQDYGLSAIIGIENGITVLSSSVTAQTSTLQYLMRTEFQNLSIHSPVHAAITLIDPWGKRVDLPLHMCSIFTIIRSLSLV